jgi:hypothetical protein
MKIENFKKIEELTTNNGTGGTGENRDQVILTVVRIAFTHTVIIHGTEEAYSK